MSERQEPAADATDDAVAAAAVVTDDEILEIQKAFLVYDKNRNGYVTFEEAHVVLQSVLGFDAEQTKRLIETHDKNGDGKLSYEEFIWFYSKVKQKRNDLQEIFQRFDRQGKGAISLSDARIALREMNFEDEEADVLVQLHDSNGDGLLQFDEFVQFWKTCSKV